MLKIPHQNYENHENHLIQRENQENHENTRIPLRINKLMKIIEFHKGITKIIKII